MESIRKPSNTFIVIIVCFVIILLGCNPIMVPLKGKYSNKAAEITTSKSMDTVWSKLKYIFTTNGLQIKSLDKNKGIIRTVKAPITSIYTFEDQNGQLEQPLAWIILPKIFNKKKEWKPKDIDGQWSFQITETKEGGIIIKIEPIIICTYFPNAFTQIEVRGQTTGKLEELLERSLNSN